MLSDNIRYYRKKNNLSQDELAERIGVSRQSVSFWENGQTQPTIDNIIALTKIFNISTDMLLGNYDSTDVRPNELSEVPVPPTPAPKKKSNAGLIVALVVFVTVLILAIIAVVIFLMGGFGNQQDPPAETQGQSQSTAPFDLFDYCKKLAIEKGQLNGDHVIYQQSATKYGGYENEYFSIAYWADSNKVEFCLHCPLSEEQSHNFYLTMRGGYNGTYEYTSSKYYRDTGESFRYATGTIDPTVFSDSYPINCDTYEAYDNSADGQNAFMEQTRVGICDLIRCLKQFVTVEKMGCDFSVFGFANF